MLSWLGLPQAWSTRPDTRRTSPRQASCSPARGGSAPCAAAPPCSTRRRAFYVWEVPYYPAYYVPVEDVDAGAPRAALDPDLRERPLRRARPRRLGRGRRLVRGGRRGLRRPSAQPLRAGRRDPLLAAASGSRSTASSSPSRAAPVLLFETGLPTRHYIQRTDVDFAAPRAHRHRHLLPLQGDDQRLLVGADRRRPPRGHRLVLRLPDARGDPDRRAGRLLRREGRHLPRRRAGGPAADQILRDGGDRRDRRRRRPRQTLDRPGPALRRPVRRRPRRLDRQRGAADDRRSARTSPSAACPGW